MDFGVCKQDLRSLMGRITNNKVQSHQSGVPYICHLMTSEQSEVIICKYFAMSEALPKER